MIEFIARYWIQFVFGLITTGMGIFCKKVWDLYKKEKNTQKTEEQKKFYAELITEIRKEHEYSNESDKVIQGQVDTLKGDLSILKEGILSL